MKSIYRICLSTLILSCITIGKINSQTTYSFNPCGATGQFGPTQAQVNAMYLGTNLNGSVVISTQGVQNFTIPVTSNYSIVAAGAGGGAANANGGRGKILSGIINLPAGTVLKIVVGQKIKIQ